MRWSEVRHLHKLWPASVCFMLFKRSAKKFQKHTALTCFTPQPHLLPALLVRHALISTPAVACPLCVPPGTSSIVKDISTPPLYLPVLCEERRCPSPSR